MSKQFLIGLDVGSGGGRCLVVDAATGAAVSVHQPWQLAPDPQAGSFAFRLEPERLLQTLSEVTRRAVQQIGAAPKQVIGIAATSMRHGTVVLDRGGAVLLAAPNRDARAAAQGMQLAAERSEEIYRLTGHAPSPIFSAARLLWLKENRPELWKKPLTVLSVSDWIGYWLSGELASEAAQAGESLLLDLRNRKWAGGLLKDLGISERMFPALKTAGSRLGKLSRAAAEALGLQPGIPVAVGGPDTQSGLLGAGALSAGQIGVIAGTTTPVQMVLDQLLLDPQMRLWSGLHLLPGRYILESNAGLMGATLEYVARLLFGESPDPVRRLFAEAARAPVGSHGVVSTVGAGVFQAAALEPPVDNLSFSSAALRSGEEGRADLARAILEGTAYAVRANVEQILSVTGGKVEGLWLGGGLTRSHLWTQMIADVMGCPVWVAAHSEASALGAAICAGVAAGDFPDLVAGARRLATPARQHRPGEAAERYQTLYAGWKGLRQARQPADRMVAGQFAEAMLAEAQGESEMVAGAAASEAAFRPRIYISAEVDEAARSQLQQLGSVTYKPYRTEGILLAGDDLVNTLQGYHVLVCEVDLVDAASLLKLPDLRVIVVCRGNPVNVDLAACGAAGIPVINTPARNADAVADLAVAFLLMLARRLPEATAFLRQPGGEAGDLGRMGQAHEEFLGQELWRKTVGIVGGGAIGSKVIQRLLPFGVRILLYDPYLAPEAAVRLGAELVSWERLLQESDFISLHAPVTAETREMINAAALAKLKPGAYLVNTARAALVEQSALIEALRSGRLAGYASDVFPQEPPASDDPLLAFPNVIATPHIGGNTREIAAHQGEMVVAALQALLAGRPPRNLLNPEVLASFRWSGPRQMDLVALQKLQSAAGPGVTDLDHSRAEASAAQPVVPSPSAKAVTHPAVTLIQKESLPMDQEPTRQKMLEILQEFTRRVKAEKEFADFARGKQVTFSFTIKDLDQAFYMSFMDGQVEAGLGAPPREPEVRLKMSADTLDGMFTGRINATKAATSGKLSFSGDTGKAMSFIRIQGAMSRLYKEAREQIGDPGDLTHLAQAAAAAVPSSTAALNASSPIASAASAPYGASPAVKTGDVRDQILQITHELFAAGLITPTGGNISARCEDNPEQIWITPSAIFKGDLRPEMMVRIDLEGHILGDTDYTASSERRVHCAIYRRRPEIGAVVHTHAPYATLLALTGTPFLPISTEAAFFGELPVVPFIMPGTDELAEQVAEAMGAQGTAVLMQNHGLVVAGSNLRRAADSTAVIESTAHKLITCRLMGVQPPVLPEAALRELREISRMMA